jgi:hypothetical protein
MENNEKIVKSVLPPEVLEFRDFVELAMHDMIADSGNDFVLKDFDLKHDFTERFYIREITMEKGDRVLSKIHKTQHPFWISEGKVLVRTFEGGTFRDEILEAPYKGITEVGTLRILRIIERCVWTTFHERLPNETVEEIEERIIEKHTNKLLPSHNESDGNLITN